MLFLRRLPIYATGVALGVLLLATAEARDWSGWTTLLFATVLAVAYMVTILLPALIHEQVSRRGTEGGGTEDLPASRYLYEIQIRDETTGAPIKPNGRNGTAAMPVTSGPVAVPPTRTRVHTP